MYRWLAVLIVAIAVSATLLWGSRRGGSGGHAPAGARVREHGGILVVRLSGAPRAKGRALGEALRERIRKELARGLPGEPELVDFAVRTCGERLAPFLPDAYREEIAGVAEGAGIAFDEALFLDTRFEISAFGLARGRDDLPSEGAVGPGPEAACLLPEDALDLVVAVHEDRDPPLVLVHRPGMTGGFLGMSGDVAAAMRPIREETPPPLGGLVWTLLFRRLLEAAPEDTRVDGTGPLSVAMTLPGRGAATLNVGVSGAAWRGAAGPYSLTTDEPVVPRAAAAIPSAAAAIPRVERDAGAHARIAEDAARLLAGPPPPGMIRVSLSGGSLVVEGATGRRTVPLFPD